jgi:hypothetical protein
MESSTSAREKKVSRPDESLRAKIDCVYSAPSVVERLQGLNTYYDIRGLTRKRDRFNVLTASGHFRDQM